MIFYKAKQEQHLELPNELLGVVSPQPALFVPVPRLFQLCEYIIVARYFLAIRIDIDQSSRYCVQIMKRSDWGEKFDDLRSKFKLEIHEINHEKTFFPVLPWNNATISSQSSSTISV